MEVREIRVGVMGGSGYVGGELLRLLVQHPRAKVTAVSSQTYQGKAVARVHPNLRGVPLDKFIGLDIPLYLLATGSVPTAYDLQPLAIFAVMSMVLIWIIGNAWRWRRREL